MRPATTLASFLRYEARDVDAASKLLALLRDPHPAVRSGACYGLVGLRHVDGVRERLNEVERKDASADVRLAAALVRNAV